MARAWTGSTANYLASAVDSLDLVGNFTYALWAKAASFAAHGTYLSKGKSGTNAGYAFRHNTSRQLEILKSNVALLGTSSGTIPNNTDWHHVAVTRSSNTYTFYIDGGSAGTASNSTTINNTTQLFQIGRDVDLGAGSLAFNGNLAEAAVWSTPLAADEIAALAKGAAPLLVRPANIEAYWPIYGVASPEPDLSGGPAPAERHMTVNGTLAAADHAPAGPPVRTA